MPRVNLWYTQGKKSQEYSKIFFVTLKKIFLYFQIRFLQIHAKNLYNFADIMYNLIYHIHVLEVWI